MLRISKLTDYGIVVVLRLAEAPAESPLSVTDLAEDTGIPATTAAKVLKQLARGEIVVSQRGVHGGYRLARSPEAITVAQVIEALEGPIGVTECATEVSECGCEFEARCDARPNWQRINQAVHAALSEISVAEMMRPEARGLVPLARSAAEAGLRRRAPGGGP